MISVFESAISNPEERSSVQQGLFGTDSSGLFSRLHAAMTMRPPGWKSTWAMTGVFLDAFV
jgi:hypothetical protein